MVRPGSHARAERRRRASRSARPSRARRSRSPSRCRPVSRGSGSAEFWSYFPLQDETSASALFNAPWSVNDDRTTLLHNDYNREILRTLSEMFVDLLPRTRTAEDPAAHLDYMPARGRELLSFGDELLIAHIPVFAAKRGIIPDATGRVEACDRPAPARLRCHIRRPRSIGHGSSRRTPATTCRMAVLRDAHTRHPPARPVHGGAVGRRGRR